MCDVNNAANGLPSKMVENNLPSMDDEFPCKVDDSKMADATLSEVEVKDPILNTLLANNNTPLLDEDDEDKVLITKDDYSTENCKIEVFSMNITDRKRRRPVTPPSPSSSSSSSYSPRYSPPSSPKRRSKVEMNEMIELQEAFTGSAQQLFETLEVKLKELQELLEEYRTKHAIIRDMVN